MGLERLNAGFLLHVLAEQSEYGELNTPGLRSSMDRWWANCLRDEAERAFVAQAIAKVRAGEKFTREMYEAVLGRRKSEGAFNMP